VSNNIKKTEFHNLLSCRWCTGLTPPAIQHIRQMTAIAMTPFNLFFKMDFFIAILHFMR
jgi:hypothetical protein